MLQEIELARQIHSGSIKFPHWDVSEPTMRMPDDGREVAVGDLAFLVVAGFRRHPHMNNVLTHISGAKWERVEQAVLSILDPLTASHDLSPLARNIVDLMCADRGVTGRILKPYFRDLLSRRLSPHLTALLIDHVTLLFLTFEPANRQAAGIVVQDSRAPN